ncbi:MAG: DUF4442 domain-containing protein [Bdellovibrionales bacterium]|nr:DUF4442 domain-containing protein [Bdellovibrionales bacterium]
MNEGGHVAAYLLRKIAGKAPLGLMKILGSLWPPYLGAGIQVLDGTPDYRYIKVCLKRSWYNSNYVGTQFGGSIYAMTDPFYMMMIMNNLGSRYIVWDKAAQVDFLKPGRTRLYAEFRIDELLLNDIRARTANNEKYIFDLPVEVKDEHGIVIAKIVKTIFVRLKKQEALTT